MKFAFDLTKDRGLIIYFSHQVSFFEQLLLLLLSSVQKKDNSEDSKDGKIWMVTAVSNIGKQATCK